jgi:hypothetical protein
MVLIFGAGLFSIDALMARSAQVDSPHVATKPNTHDHV